MSQVQQLYQLQQIDTEIREKKQRLREVLRTQKETAVLLAMRKRMETAVAALQSWQEQQQTLNQELQRLRNKAKSAEQRLYSGNVKNPKELTDLQRKIEALGRRSAAQEDQILEAMIQIEDAETEQAAAAAALQQSETEWQAEQAKLKRDQTELALRLHTLMEKREEQLSRVTAVFLTEYETLSRQKGGTAVAKINKHICTGCRLNVSTQKEKEAREGKKVYCASCGRILAV